MKTGSSYNLVVRSERPFAEGSRVQCVVTGCSSTTHNFGDFQRSFTMRQNCTFQILAPSIARPTNSFARLKSDKQSYNHLLASMQRLRARVYLKDGAIQPWEIDNDGRFHMPGDEQCWHLLLVDDAKEVVGCARYLVHDKNVRYENLRVSHSPLAKDASWGEKLRTAVDSDLQRARAEGLCYVEVGGWALAEEWRNTKAALEILV
ncbi:MAG: GNAT family N-acetyltransferase, partial [Acidobacteriaceae bacterium]|nr:GNAT family N-acetyltransferase [Acidobacteriaceae bacterium]